MLFLFSVLVTIGMIVNQKYVRKAIHSLLIPKQELMPIKVTVMNAVKKR
ncbi:MAG: hypothetical protein JWQ14_201 [Adhaeribacter sp.]|nr:hypothetical protein [Adhaeribacter sp.]